jgi:hypothetical protein
MRSLLSIYLGALFVLTGCGGAIQLPNLDAGRPVSVGIVVDPSDEPPIVLSPSGVLQPVVIAPEVGTSGPVITYSGVSN